MQAHLKMAFLESPENYQLLKENSYYIKYLNRNQIDFKKFSQDMKEKYKKRPTDKLESLAENIDLITSILNVLK